MQEVLREKITLLDNLPRLTLMTFDGKETRQGSYIKYSDIIAAMLPIKKELQELGFIYSGGKLIKQKSHY